MIAKFSEEFYQIRAEEDPLLSMLKWWLQESKKEAMMIAQAIIYEFGQRYPEAIGRLFAVLALPPNRQTKNQLHQCLGAYRQGGTKALTHRIGLSLPGLLYQTHRHLPVGLGDGKKLYQVMEIYKARLNVACEHFLTLSLAGML